MTKIWIGSLVTLALGAAAAWLIVTSGVIDVGADTAHSPLVNRAIAFAREQSIARRTADIQVPATLRTDPERVRRGAGNYAAMCVSCHLAPAVPDSEIRKGLHPMPPNLSEQGPARQPEQAAARQFWIIKHGIMASGMPAWSKGGMDDASIWDLVAFLQKMPGLSQADYEQLVQASDGHAHGGLNGHEDHPHGAHAH